MYEGNSIRVRVRKKLGILLLAGGLLAVWGCGDDRDDDAESLSGPPGGRSATTTVGAALTATASPAGTWTVGEPPAARPTLPTHTMGTPPTRGATRPPTATPIPQAAVQVGTATGLPGETVLVDVTLTWVESGVEIAGTQNDISFDPLVQIAAKAGGKPDCTVNPDIDKGATGFAYHPSSCEAGVDCTAVRALVMAFDNVDAIEPGSVLYTCRVAIWPEAAPGTYPLTCSLAGASDPGGRAIRLRCDHGEILVGQPTGTVVTWTPTLTSTGPSPTRTPLRPSPTPTGPTPTWVPTRTPIPQAMIRIGTTTGMPGDTVSVDVTLTSVEPGLNVLATQNDIAFDVRARIAEREGGRPDCAVNPDIDKTATVFSFLPPPCDVDGCTTPCSGDECTGIRAVVLAFNNFDPIPQGSLLYTCNVAISADAEPGNRFPLTCLRAHAGDPTGRPLGLRCDDGQVLVGSE